MLEIMRKYTLKVVREGKAKYEVDEKIDSPATLARVFEATFKLSELAEEYFVMIVLDTKNVPVGAFIVSVGSLNSSIVHPREVFKRVLLLNGNKFVVAHNHPSGNTTPSQEDDKVTKRLAEGAEILGVQLLDHIIIGTSGEDYFSYMESAPEFF